MTVFNLMPLVVYLPAGIYFYHFFKRFLTLFHIDKKRKVSKISAVIFALFCAALGWRVYGLGAVVVLHFLVCSIVMEGVNLIVKRAVKKDAGRRVWEVVYKSGIASVLIMALLFGYGYVNIHQVRETAYTVSADKEIGEDLRIAQISDLHMGTTMDVQKLQEYCDEIMKREPDLIALTGDIFDERTEKELMEETVKVLGSMHVRYGIYYVWGNHDPNRYTSEPYYSMDQLRETLEANNITVLEDEVVTVTPQITVAGRVDASMPDDRTEISELLQGVDQNSYILLLDHQPVGLEENAAAGVDLQLSGHTHAGQIWPTGQLGELTGVTEKNYGLKTIKDYHVIVSSGIAGWGYAIRTGGHSEYVIVDVKNE